MQVKTILTRFEHVYTTETVIFVYPTIKNGGLNVCYKILSIRDFEGYEKYICMKASLYVYPV